MKGPSKVLKAKKELFGIELLFGRFDEYQEKMEEFLTKSSLRKAKQISDYETIDKEAEKAGEYQREYAMFLQDSLIEQWLDFSKMYPHYFRVSLLTFVTSFIESELYAICKDHYTKNQTGKPVTDIKANSVLDKLKKYLSGEAKIDFNKLNPEWSTIRTFWKIRNLFVHANGHISDKHNHLNEIELFAENNSAFITLENTDQDLSEGSNIKTVIITGKGFNQMLIDKAKGFFIKLMKELDEREKSI